MFRIFTLNKELAQIQLVHGLDSRNDSYIRSKLFYAERNSYLTGMTLFLSLYVQRGPMVLRAREARPRLTMAMSSWDSWRMQDHVPLPGRDR